MPKLARTSLPKCPISIPALLRRVEASELRHANHETELSLHADALAKDQKRIDGLDQILADICKTQLAADVEAAKRYAALEASALTRDLDVNARLEKLEAKPQSYQFVVTQSGDVFSPNAAGEWQRFGRMKPRWPIHLLRAIKCGWSRLTDHIRAAVESPSDINLPDYNAEHPMTKGDACEVGDPWNAPGPDGFTPNQLIAALDSKQTYGGVKREADAPQQTHYCAACEARAKGGATTHSFEMGCPVCVKAYEGVRQYPPGKFYIDTQLTILDEDGPVIFYEGGPAANSETATKGNVAPATITHGGKDVTANEAKGK